jgi:hypothetical protein
MRLLEKMCFVVLASGLALGQATASNSGSAGSGSVADELKALREAISEQQKQISQQQQQIQTLQQQLVDKTSGTPHVADAALRTAPAPAPVTATVVQETEKKESPLSFRIGGTEFTPGGYVDFENVFRTTNATGATGNPIATSFGAIPFSNTVQGHLTEFRSTGQYSRYSLKITGKYGANNVLGYIEGDFNGNDAANVFTTANGHTNRLRLYWLDLKRGNWEFLGGSTWGLETPNRVGLSPMPSDLALTIGEDSNVHVGIPYTRAAEFRAVYHFSDRFQWGVALQNPDQFVATGAVNFPFQFNAVLGQQFDPTQQTGTPNAFPDILSKLAFDNDAHGKHFHFELGGMATNVKIAAVPIGGTQFDHHSKVGGSFFGAFNAALSKSFRVLANVNWGAGNGRYLIGTQPQAVVFPIQTGPASFNLDVSMVHAGAALVGAEATAKNSQFGFYWGGFYAQRNAFPDVTNPTTPAPISCMPGEPAVGKPCIGFGGPNSPPSANRAIQEASVDWTQTFWRNPQYGAVLLITQTSYLTRAPWFVPAGAPKNAHLMMGWVSLRYVLP